MPSKVEIPFVVSDQNGKPIPNATVNVYARNSDGSNGSLVTTYVNGNTADSTAGTNPFLTDAKGKMAVWVQPAQLNIVVSGTNILGDTLGYDAAIAP